MNAGDHKLIDSISRGPLDVLFGDVDALLDSEDPEHEKLRLARQEAETKLLKLRRTRARHSDAAAEVAAALQTLSDELRSLRRRRGAR